MPDFSESDMRALFADLVATMDRVKVQAQAATANTERSLQTATATLDKANEVAGAVMTTAKVIRQTRSAVGCLAWAVLLLYVVAGIGLAVYLF
jgi:hypothetical protein